ncbi:hypothetical protein BJ742DRAFT_742621 [Cladochytrium replicatum]|nr:hypothetical protein BJ742DRAFT_742621 [Cladochytrium replicatum]
MRENTAGSETVEKALRVAKLKLGVFRTGRHGHAFCLYTISVPETGNTNQTIQRTFFRSRDLDHLVFSQDVGYLLRSGMLPSGYLSDPTHTLSESTGDVYISTEALSGIKGSTDSPGLQIVRRLCRLDASSLKVGAAEAEDILKSLNGLTLKRPFGETVDELDFEFEQTHRSGGSSTESMVLDWKEKSVDSPKSEGARPSSAKQGMHSASRSNPDIGQKRTMDDASSEPPSSAQPETPNPAMSEDRRKRKRLSIITTSLDNYPRSAQDCLHSNADTNTSAVPITESPAGIGVGNSEKPPFSSDPTPSGRRMSEKRNHTRLTITTPGSDGNRHPQIMSAPHDGPVRPLPTTQDADAQAMPPPLHTPSHHLPPSGLSFRGAGQLRQNMDARFPPSPRNPEFPARRLPVPTPSHMHPVSPSTGYTPHGTSLANHHLSNSGGSSSVHPAATPQHTIHRDSHAPPPSSSHIHLPHNLGSHPPPITAVQPPLVSRTHFLSVFEGIYDQMEESIALQRTLKDQIRKSAALLQTLQGSATMIEGLVQTHFGKMQMTYGEKFGMALTQLNRRLRVIEDMMGVDPTANGSESGNHENAGMVSARLGPQTGVGGSQMHNGQLFSARGTFHVGGGPLSAIGGIRPGGAPTGGAEATSGYHPELTNRILQSVLDRLEALEKKIGVEPA